MSAPMELPLLMRYTNLGPGRKFDITPALSDHLGISSLFVLSAENLLAIVSGDDTL